MTRPVSGKTEYSLADAEKNPVRREKSALAADFRNEVQDFLQQAGIPEDSNFSITRSPVYIVTGASFTPYDPAMHGDDPTHAFAAITGENGERYLMNNTAALVERLVQDGERVIVHTKNPELTQALLAGYQTADKCRVIGGRLDDPSILKTIHGALADMARDEPVTDIRMALYQSFAQNNGEPFKPMHRESIAEVERAASQRIRFVYNMAALGYDLLVNRGLENLRIVSLSALASNRASYGLLADASDKVMNDLLWRTFHIEANNSTGKPVTIFQINPGITTACDVYRTPKSRETVLRESIADGFPLEEAVFSGEKPLPQINSLDVAAVADALLRTPDHANPNEAVSEDLRALLYGGFSPEELAERMKRAISSEEDRIEIDPDHSLPEHIFAPGTSYGALPQTIKPGDYRRISLTPPGQHF